MQEKRQTCLDRFRICAAGDISGLPELDQTEYVIAQVQTEANLALAHLRGISHLESAQEAYISSVVPGIINGFRKRLATETEPFAIDLTMGSIYFWSYILGIPVDYSPPASDAVISHHSLSVAYTDDKKLLM